MKKQLALLSMAWVTVACFGQRGFGFDVGFSTSKAPMVALKYFLDKNAASIGFSYQFFNDALGSKEDALIPGTIAIGDGDYFYSVDAGYTRVLSDNFALSVEVSFVKREYYQNLSDNSFSEGGYHVIYKTKNEVGFGGFLTYYVSDLVGLFAGYNSTRKAAIGVQFRFLH